MRRTSRQSLELFVLELAHQYNIPLKLTAGSGNHWGDADLRMVYDSERPIHIGVECKDSPSGARATHNIPPKEWLKAISQIGRRADVIPIMVTRIRNRSTMAHIRLRDLQQQITGHSGLVEICQEYKRVPQWDIWHSRALDISNHQLVPMCVTDIADVSVAHLELEPLLELIGKVYNRE